MMIISKYFNTINEYINIEKCCKEYNGIIEQFKYNPIPFKNEQERELFKNVETYHFYDKEIEEEKIIMKDERIKKSVHWRKVSYSEWKKNKREDEEYKSVEFGQEDVKKYLYDHEEGYWVKTVLLKTEKVELEEGITSIGYKCFTNCSNLIEISIPSSVSSIGNECFDNCINLSTINIPTSVFEIGIGCFSECLNLSTINIPSSVISIGDNCFEYCSNLRGYVSIDINNPIYYTKDGTRIRRKDNNKIVNVWNKRD